MNLMLISVHEQALDNSIVKLENINILTKTISILLTYLTNLLINVEYTDTLIEGIVKKKGMHVPYL